MNPRKPSISDLFLPIAKTFDDYRREWRILCNQENAATTPSLREYFARKRTAIVETFPAWERPAILDKLNQPLESQIDTEVCA